MLNIKKILGLNEDKKFDRTKTWLPQLEELDDASALKYSAKQLALSMQQDTAKSLESQVMLLLAIEADNEVRLERLSIQYSSIDNLKADIEKNICEACYDYCRQSYLYHLKLIEEVITPAQIKLQGDIPVLLVARALAAAFNMVKWRLFHQSNPPLNAWLQINTLYKIAQQQMLLNIPVEIFKSHPSTTLSACFVQIYMLGQLLSAGLQKYQIEIAAQLLTRWLTRAHISSQYSQQQYLFYVDLEKDLPAKRMRDFIPNDQCRYWELDELEKLINVAITVTNRGEMPQNLFGAKIEHVKRLNDTLKTMFAEWNRANYVRQRRKTPRQATSKTAKATAGIEAISEQVLQANQIANGLRLSRGPSLDDRLRAHTVLRQTSLSPNSGTLNTWIVTDESARGLGIRVNKFGNILVRQDKLVGLSMDDDPSKMIVGMIRGVKPTNANQLRAGVEIISHHPVYAHAKLARQNGEPTSQVSTTPNTGPNKMASMDYGVFPAIYLPIEAGLSENSALLLPKIHFRPNTIYEITLNGTDQHMKLGEAVESRDDWVKVLIPF